MLVWVWTAQIKSYWEIVPMLPVTRPVKEFVAKLDVPKIASHDLRWSSARLGHAPGGELEQIQFVRGQFQFRQPRNIMAASNGWGAVNDRDGY